MEREKDIYSVYEDEFDEIPDSAAGYTWQGYDALGKFSKLESYEKNAADAETEILEAGIRIISMKPRTMARPVRHLPKNQELATLARNFGEQIEAGSTPKEIIKMFAESEENETIKDALHGALTALNNGRELHEAFQIQKDHKGRQVFPTELITALEIGHVLGAAYNPDAEKKQSGVLITLTRFAEGQEKKDKFKAAIRSAMMYPAIVTLTAIGAIGAVTVFVMPVMENMYKSLLQGKSDTSLPFLTRVMLGISHFVWSFQGAVALLAAIFGIFLLYRWLKSPRGKDFVGRRIIFLPKIGHFYRMLYASQLLRYLSMLTSGVSDIKSQMSLAAETTENPVFKEMLENIAYQYRVQGKELTPMFKPYLYLFGRGFLGNLLTADKTGDPSGPFYRHAMVLEMKLNRELETVLMVLKTVIIFPLGIVVALIVASIILPFFELAGRLSS